MEEMLLRVVIVFVSMTTLLAPASGKAEEFVPLSDEGEGTHCDQEERISNTCLSCAALPLSQNVPLYECCSSDIAFEVCDACIHGTGACQEKMDVYRDKLENDVRKEETEVEKMYKVDLSQLGPSRYGRQKRFGTLFMGNNKKRYGRLFFGKRTGYENEDVIDDVTPVEDDDLYANDPELGNEYDSLFLTPESLLGKQYGNTGVQMDGEGDGAMGGTMEKRYGRLFVKSGPYFGKRKDANENLDSDVMKRYGSLFIKPSSYFGKRDTDEDSTVDMDKRYGRLYMGSGSLFDKRSDLDLDNHNLNNDLDFDKRFGRLYMGSGQYFGKRDDMAYGSDTDKRFGRLYVGSSRGFFGKRNKADDLDIDLDKRWGRVYMGSGSYFGKRIMENKENQDGEEDKRKRYGSLFFSSKFGKRSTNNLRLNMDRRFGRLFFSRAFRPYYRSLSDMYNPKQ